MGIGVVGIAALLGLDVGGAQLLPILAVALTVIGYATGPLVITRSLPDVPGVAASSIALFVTAVVYAPFAIPRLDEVADASGTGAGVAGRPGRDLHGPGTGAVLRLIREVGPQRALVITFVNPAVAVLLGVLLLDEPFTLGIAIGLPLVLVGCVLATRRSPVRTEPSELCDVDSAVP